MYDRETIVAAVTLYNRDQELAEGGHGAACLGLKGICTKLGINSPQTLLNWVNGSGTLEHREEAIANLQKSTALSESEQQVVTATILECRSKFTSITIKSVTKIIEEKTNGAFSPSSSYVSKIFHLFSPSKILAEFFLFILFPQSPQVVKELEIVDHIRQRKV